MNCLLKAAAALLCAIGTISYASTTSVTATLTDKDSTLWSNCAWSAVVSSPYPPTIGGVAVPDSQLRAAGSCSSSGVMTATILDTSSVQQSGVTWTFTIQPNASAKPSTIAGVSVTGTSIDLSTTLSTGLNAPRFDASTNAFGYADIEVRSSSLGNTYFNTGTVCGGPSLRQLSQAGWQCGGSGGGSTNPATDSIFGTIKLASGQTSTTLSKVATTGNYADIYGIPTLAPSALISKVMYRFGCFGDSYDYMSGATSSSRGYCSLMRKDTPFRYSTMGDNAVQGALMSGIANNVVLKWQPDPSLPSLMSVGGGENDYNICTSGSAACIIGFSRYASTPVYWGAIAPQQRILASNMTQAGTWSAAPAYANAQTGNVTGTPLVTSTSGSTLTFTIPSTNNGEFGMYVYAQSGTTGGATYTITNTTTSTNYTDTCSATTTFTALGCGANFGAGPQRIRLATSAGVSNSITFTSTSATTLIIIGADWTVSTIPANTNYVKARNAGAAYDVTGWTATALASVVTQAQGDGLTTVSLVDARAALLALPDGGVSQTSTATYIGSTQLNHPRDGGHLAMETAALAATFPDGAIVQALDAGTPEIESFDPAVLGVAIASAATIAPLTTDFHVTGTAAINTITFPPACINSGTVCHIKITPDGAFTFGGTGNVLNAYTATVGSPIYLVGDPATAKWYGPSNVTNAVVLRSATAANTDSVGTLTVAAGTTTSTARTFTGTYATTPTCILDTQNATAADKAALGVVAPQVSTTSLSATVSTAPVADVTLQYSCYFHN